MTKLLPFPIPPQKTQYIFDLLSSCYSKCHQIIEGLYSCRIWHMLTVHWIAFAVHHVEFLSQVLAISSLTIRLLPFWQGDYSTKMREHVSLLSLKTELFIWAFPEDKPLGCGCRNKKLERRKKRKDFWCICQYSMLCFSYFTFLYCHPIFSAFNFFVVLWDAVG